MRLIFYFTSFQQPSTFILRLKGAKFLYPSKLERRLYELFDHKDLRNHFHRLPGNLHIIQSRIMKQQCRGRNRSWTVEVMSLNVPASIKERPRKSSARIIDVPVKSYDSRWLKNGIFTDEFSPFYGHNMRLI